ncbi:MAG: sugar phosphate nucleotidyltransferase [Patescibacteria group bacterium]|jgi:mannose-1-phosphate guanylyltransferase
MLKIVILAGGTGTRFWPQSRESTPKQFSKIIADKTMIELTYERFLADFKKEDIYFSTNQKFAKIIKKIFPKVSKENIIIEPEKRDTAPAMGFVAAYLDNKFPNDPMVFIPSDHYIADVKKFIQSLKLASKFIEKTGKMMDIAITPNFPSTVLGYTHIGKKSQETNGIKIYEFKGHVEKPDYKTAERYLKAGDYLWHANFYMWTPKLFLEAYKKYSPIHYKSLAKIKEYLKNKDLKKADDEFKKMPKDSIDYAITEKMDPKDVLIIKGEFGWSDIGAWDVLYDQLSKEQDASKNMVKAVWEGLDTTGCLVYGPKDKIIATIGVDDMIIIDTPDALLVCPQSRAQDVKKIVESLKAKKKEKYL